MNSTIDPHKVPQKILVSGEKIPCIGMGTYGSDHFSADEIADAVLLAVSYGYRMFDCASVYGNEVQIGKAFSVAFEEGRVTRDELFVTSKIWNDMHGRGDVLISCAQTVKDLGLDAIDLYFLHWPFPQSAVCQCDSGTPDMKSRTFSADSFLHTWRQMESLVDMGLVRYIGMSNMTIPKLEAILPLCRINPVAIQMELHPSFQQEELFNYCIEHKIQPIGFCPIGSPMRPDSETMQSDIVDIALPEVLSVAKAHHVHPAVVCLKWAVQRGQIPIPFAVDAQYLLSNLECVTNDPLSDAEMQLIRNSDYNCRLIKGRQFLWEDAKGWEDLWDIDGTITR